MGYFAQHQLDQLDMSATPLLTFQRIAERTDEQTLRKYLGSFGFHGDEVNARIERFSGGEKSRLALALIVWRKPNVLLLDEPTNHLDLEMRHALTVALQDFEGALVLVSHDRHLLRSVCDEFWLVADGRAQPFDGDMDDYARWLAEYKARQSEGNAAMTGQSTQGPGDATDTRQDRKQDRRRAAEIRERTRPLRQRIEALEKSLEKQQTRRATIETSLADSSLYETNRKDELTRLLREQASVASEIDRIESDWLEAQEALETLTRQLQAG